MPGYPPGTLLTGVDHVACPTRDPARPGAFYAAVFDAKAADGSHPVGV